MIQKMTEPCMSNNFSTAFLRFKIFSIIPSLVENIHVYFVEGGQRPVPAAPPVWVLTVWDLFGFSGRVYVRKVCT